MSDVFQLVLPSAIGLTESEVMKQCEMYWRANQAIQKLISGEYSPDDVADHLKAIDVDPMVYRDEVMENMEQVYGAF